MIENLTNVNYSKLLKVTLQYMITEVEYLRMSSGDILKFLGEDESKLRDSNFTDYESILKNHQGYIDKFESVHQGTSFDNQENKNLDGSINEDFLRDSIDLNYSGDNFMAQDLSLKFV